LLLISRIENDQYAKNDAVDLRDLVEEVISNIEERAMIADISIENRIPDEIKLLQVNKYLIYILLFNLVSNAIKYNKVGGFVTISTGRNGSGSFVEVADNGMGIEAENLDLIFTRFKRMEINKEEGQGLGLSIANSIAAFHDAKIEVTSTPGEGSQFKVFFPLKNLK
jgi:two-component system, OmpR family, sensor histidine kinase ArlS